MDALPSQPANAVVLHGSEAIVLQQCCSNRNVWQEGRTSGGPGKIAASRERYTICTTVQAETREEGLPATEDEGMPALADSDAEEEPPLLSVDMEPPAPPVQMEPPPPPANTP